MKEEYTRIAWASAHLQSVWEPRIQRINHAWRQVEIDSVREGIRLAALVFDPMDLDLHGVKLSTVADRLIVEREDNEIHEQFIAYWNARNDKGIGSLLGFPECCRTFFHRVWNVEGKKDTTLSMGSGYSVAGNILGRWLGVRFVPHLPCTFNCIETGIFASHLDMLWPKDEWLWANDILSWPVEYTALHGVAEIKFPILKIVTRTDYTKGKHAVKLIGTSYPDDAPKGLSFPFQQPNFTPLGKLKAKVKPLHMACSVQAAKTNGTYSDDVHYDVAIPDTWTDNGFTSLEAMNAAHAMIKKHVLLSVKTILDIGSGNGVLLQSIASESQHPIKVHGLEANADRAARAKVPTTVGLLENIEQLITDSYDVAMISMRRIEEMTNQQRKEFGQWCSDHVENLLVYSYDEPMFARLE